MNEGWRCPQCGGVYAPWVFRCTKCPSVEGGAAGAFIVDPCDHQWVTDTAGTRCIKCGARIQIGPATL